MKDDDQAPDDQSMHFLCSPTAMIQENTPSETVVYTAEAVDPDGLPVRYALDAVSTPDNVYFTLDAENGDLRFRARIGDINGDGVDDILIGSAWAHTVFGSFTVQAFVVFGSSDPRVIAQPVNPVRTEWAEWLFH